jgi:Heavy metal associated domain 2
MNPTLILSIMSAVTAAVWSVWTWREEQETARQLKRDQESALFVNSFIQAMEELQVRLYGILERDDLAFFKKDYPKQEAPDFPIGLEILYRLSKFFGWTYRIFRYGPYTNDPVVIELVRRISDTLESHTRFSGDAFRFTYEERVALGDAVVRRTGDMIGAIPVYESITVFQFWEEICNKSGKRYLLFQSRAFRRTLDAIDQAGRVEELEGVERLAVLQNHVVDLLAYLEGMEGFTVSPGKRRKARLRGASAKALVAPPTHATVVHQTPGRIRLRVPRLKTDDMYVSRLQSLLESVDHVNSIRLNISAASVVIDFNPEIPETEFAGRLTKTITTGFPAA